MTGSDQPAVGMRAARRCRESRRPSGRDRRASATALGDHDRGLTAIAHELVDYALLDDAWHRRRTAHNADSSRPPSSRARAHSDPDRETPRELTAVEPNRADVPVPRKQRHEAVLGVGTVVVQEPRLAPVAAAVTRHRDRDVVGERARESRRPANARPKARAVMGCTEGKSAGFTTKFAPRATVVAGPQPPVPEQRILQLVVLGVGLEPTQYDLAVRTRGEARLAAAGRRGRFQRAPRERRGRLRIARTRKPASTAAASEQRGIHPLIRSRLACMVRRGQSDTRTPAVG